MPETNPDNSVTYLADALARLGTLLTAVIIPNLRTIQENQIEQRQQSEWLATNLEEFRLEMQQRFAELHAELAASRAQIEDAMVVIREHKAVQLQGRKPTIH
jgi:hypothetical protein